MRTLESYFCPRILIWKWVHPMTASQGHGGFGEGEVLAQGSAWSRTQKLVHSWSQPALLAVRFRDVKERSLSVGVERRKWEGEINEGFP